MKKNVKLAGIFTSLFYNDHIPCFLFLLLFLSFRFSWYTKSKPSKICDFRLLVWAKLVTDIFHHFLRSCRNGIRRKHYAYSSWGYGFESCLSRWYYICHGLVFFFSSYLRSSFLLCTSFILFFLIHSFIHSFRPSGLGLYVRLTK